MTLDTPIRSAGRTYALAAKKLEKLGIVTLGDLLMHFPSRYDDYSLTTTIDHAQNGQVVTVVGTVLSTQNVYTRGRFQIQKVVVADVTGTIECIWFNQPYVVRNIKTGDTLSVAGRVEQNYKGKTLQVKEFENISAENAKSVHTQRLVPVYPETRGLSSRWIRNKIFHLLETEGTVLPEYLPESILSESKLILLNYALKYIHFPKDYTEAEIARARLAYDELFLIQLQAIHRKNEWKIKKATTPFDIQKFQDHIKNFCVSLPFELTQAQNQAINDILNDISQPTPMNRLLQGDVGSGKTVVGAVAMYIAKLNGFQSALMAPTQVLAQQHFETLQRLFEPHDISVSLLTSSSKGKAPSVKGKGKGKMNASHFPLAPDILVGTHALIQKGVDFKNLGLVIVDEQHRFGVHQRSILRDKGNIPHYLSMTATPIPRTIFLTMYGDLELSILDELPKGRQKIKTWLVPNHKRENAYKWIEKTVNEKDSKDRKNQVFIVCPFIEESESMTTVRAAVKEFETLQKKIFPKLKLGLLHGKMKATEKNEVLEKFQSGTLDILVATPVVEVGIDIPNATVIVIEAAERFGLASLHQLRGRVGRSDKQSYCLLFTESENQKTIQRLKALESNHSGSALAELDLKQRGAGDMYGTQQHGSRMLKVASFGDSTLIHKTQLDAQKIYPAIKNHPILHEKLKSTIIQSKVNPD